MSLVLALRQIQKQQNHQVFIVDQRLWILESQVYTYPDVMVVAGELELQAGRRDTITNPVLIAEVLSESTEKRDRTTKFNAYGSIPSFAEYLLISQDRILVEHFTKERSGSSDRWIYQNYDKLESEINLSSISVTLKLADLYDKVEYDQVESETFEVFKDRELS